MARGEVRYRITAESSEFQRAFNAARSEVRGFGQDLASHLGPAGSVLQAMGPAGLVAAAGFGAIAVGAGAAAVAVGRAIEKADQIANISAQTGMAAEAIQRLAPAAITSGSSIEALANGVSKLQVKLVQAPSAFNQLNLSAARLVQMKPEDAISRVAQAISQIENPAQRAAAAAQYLGLKAGPGLLPALLALSSMKGRAEELGLVLSNQMVSALDSLGDELDLTKAAGDAVVTNFGAVIGTAPGVETGVRAMGLAFGDLSRVILENKGPIQEAVTGIATVFNTSLNIVANAVVNTVRLVTSNLPQLGRLARAVASGSLVGLASAAASAGATMNVPAVTWTDYSGQAASASTAPSGASGGRRTFTPAEKAAQEALRQRQILEIWLRQMQDVEGVMADISQEMTRAEQESFRPTLEELALQGVRAQEALERAGQAAEAARLQSIGFNDRLREGDMILQNGLWSRDPEVIAHALELGSTAAQQLAEENAVINEQWEAWIGTSSSLSEVFGSIADVLGGMNTTLGTTFTALTAVATSFSAGAQAAHAYSNATAAAERAQQALALATDDAQRAQARAAIGAANAQRAQAIMQGVTGVIQSGQQMGQQGGNAGAGLAGGMAQGIAAGSAFGPWGMAAGAVIGGISGYISGRSAEAERRAQQEQQVLAQLIAIAQKVRTQQDTVTAGIQQAMEAAQRLRGAIDEGVIARLQESLAGDQRGGASDNLLNAVSGIIGRISEAALSRGLGVMDPRLAESQAFNDANSVAGMIAQALQGMGRVSGAGVQNFVDQQLLQQSTVATQELLQASLAAARAALGVQQNPIGTETRGTTGEHAGPLTAPPISPTDLEANRAAFANIAPLLREQLNASLASGTRMSQELQDMITAARESGVSIIADPVLQTLDVERRQLEVLQKIANQGRGGPEAPTDSGPTTPGGPPSEPPIPYASGTPGLVTMPDLGGGLGPLIQTHAREEVLVIPASRAGKRRIIHAAEGIPKNLPGDGEELPQKGSGGFGELPQKGTVALQTLLNGMMQAAAAASPISMTTQVAATFNDNPLSTRERLEDLHRDQLQQLRNTLRQRDPEVMFELGRIIAERS